MISPPTTWGPAPPVDRQHRRVHPGLVVGAILIVAASVTAAAVYAVRAAGRAAEVLPPAARSATRDIGASTAATDLPDVPDLPSRLYGLLGDGSRVYILTDAGVVARSIPDLSFRWWQRSCHNPEWATPISRVLGERLIIRCGPRLTALDVADGHELWGFDLEANPAFTRWSATTLVLLYDNGRTEVHDAATGELRWTRPTAGGEFGPADADESTVYINEVQTLRAFDALTGEQKWEVKVTANGLWADGPTIIARAKDHHLHFIDTRTGAEMAVGPKDDVGMQNAAIMGVSADVVLAFAPKDNQVVTAYARRDGSILWQRQGKAANTWWAGISGPYVILMSGGSTGTATLEVLDATSGKTLTTHAGVSPTRPWLAGTTMLYASPSSAGGIVVEELG